MEISVATARRDKQTAGERFSCASKIKAMCVCVCSVAPSSLTFCNPLDCSLPGSTVYGIFQARILERVAVSSSRGSS